MILVFVDEAGDSKQRQYFGLCCAIINGSFYQQLKKGFQKILIDIGWSPEIEFKGSFLFSTTKGCPNVSIDQRIEAASKILGLNVANKNSRMKFVTVNKMSEDSRKDYLLYLPKLLEKGLPRAPAGRGKSLISVNCDYRNDLSVEDIRRKIEPVLKQKGYTLFEDVVTAKSCLHTVGILYADIVGYLSARIDTISTDVKLFENIPNDQLENNGALKKLRSSEMLLNLLKTFDRYEVVSRVTKE